MHVSHVIHGIQRSPKELVDLMKVFSTATIYEAYGGKGAVSHFIKPLRTDMKLCGPAVLVDARPGDNLIVHKAIYVAQPGDVLVIHAGSFVEAGFWGGVMTEAAKTRGISGLVTDGAVRDCADIVRSGFPVFCQSVSIKGTTKTCLGFINHSLYFGGIKIDPGDLIVGDSDGVVVVARADVPDVVEKAKKREEKEEEIIRELKRGKSTLELYGFSTVLNRKGLIEE